MEPQNEFKEEVLAPKIYIRTFGCQMNDRDSEEIIGMLLEKGYILSDSPQEADVILFNTCSVRKHAEDRAISNIGALQRLKGRRPEVIIGVVGCMAKAYKEKLFEKLPHVDFVCGPANIYEIPDAINHRDSPSRTVETVPYAMRGQSLLVDKENRPEIRNIAYHKEGVSALVTIMEGCNNFCSYCIVPYVRGREISRPAEDILDEIKSLADRGYKEVTLLGQNVNSYKGHEQEGTTSCTLQGLSLTQLLEEVNKVDGIGRIRFITSHPKDAGEDLFKAMRDLDKVCEHLHLPLQSGSDKILKLMNRGYTAEEFQRKVNLFRRYLPNSSITTDIIVGFPGETEEDFEATKELMKKIEFNSAFIFKYSPRPPAKASELKDDVPKKVKEGRNQILLKLQEEISSRKEKEYIGKETEVLVEGMCRKDKGKVIGRNRQNIKVALDGKSELIGKLKKVRVTSVIGHTLVGSLVTFMVLVGSAFFNEARAATAEDYFVCGDYEKAVYEAKHLLYSSIAEKDKIYYILGTGLNKLGNYKQARGNFISLIKIYPRSKYVSLAELGIADSYYLEEDYADASRWYENYVAKYPKSQGVATAYYRLAKCAQKQGSWQTAKNYYQKLKKEFPISFEAQWAAQALSEEILYFTVQVGSFNNKSNALKLCDKLIRKGYDASILKSESGGKFFYRVRVGRLNKREKAEELARRLQAEGLPTNILP